MIGVAELAALLRRGRFDLSNEMATHAEIAIFLAAALAGEVKVEREVRLTPRERIDFIVAGSIGIEVKVKGAARAAIVRQLERYAALDRIQSLILATNVSMSLPATLNGKPLEIVHMGRAWL